MILSKEEIIGFIKNPKNKPLIERAKEIFASHRLHIKGIGVQEFLARIEGYENSTQHELRKKLAKGATVPIFGKELNEFDKVFNAQGFSRYYQFTPATQERFEKDFKEYLNKDVGDGLSMKEWMESIWMDKVNYDSSGVFMIELPPKATGPLAEPYITFRSIIDIHDYDFDGNTVEYIIFKKETYDPKSDKKKIEYRVVDDIADYILIEEDGKLNFIEEQELVNPFGFVPARIISNQRDSSSRARTSYVWKAIESADEYLVDASIYSISKKLHGFPHLWMRERKCRNCKGKGKIKTGKFLEDKVTPIMGDCTDCAGCGYAIKTDVSEVTIIPALMEQGQPDNIPPMGYIARDIAVMEKQEGALDRLKLVIHEAIWSEETKQKVTGDTETAFGRLIDVQVRWSKLQTVSKNGEEVEKFAVETMAKVRYPGAFMGSIINYGRKYFVRTADEVELQYQSAKKSGMATHILDAYIEELIYLKFSNDPLELDRQLKLNSLEPFVHLSPEEVQKLNIVRTDFFMKAYFTDYIERFEKEVKPISQATDEEITAKLIEYNNAKMAEVGPPDDEDSTGKLPLALQQLALARERANTAGDIDLSNKLGAKIDELLSKIQ